MSTVNVVERLENAFAFADEATDLSAEGKTLEAASSIESARDTIGEALALLRGSS